jgi:hypothetical protein
MGLFLAGSAVGLLLGLLGPLLVGKLKDLITKA